jgi:methyl-accepting chemotaxis protein
MQAKTHRRKLRNYFINTKIQLRLAVTNLMYFILVVAIVVLTVLIPFYLDSFESLELCRQYLSAKLFIVLLGRLPIVAGALLLIIFIHQIIMSHRLCGPLVNFVHSFKKLSKGDFTRRIYLRRYDYLKDEARHLNEMIDGLSNIIADLKIENNLLVSSLEKVTDAEVAHKMQPDALEDAITHADTCQKLLLNFKLSEESNDENDHSPE